MLYFHYDGTINYHSDLNQINFRLLVQMGACLKQKEKICLHYTRNVR